MKQWSFAGGWRSSRARLWQCWQRRVLLGQVLSGWNQMGLSVAAERFPLPEPCVTKSQKQERFRSVIWLSLQLDCGVGCGKLWIWSV